MTHSDIDLLENLTIKLNRAKSELNKAQKAVLEKSNAVTAARENLNATKRKAAEAIPVDRSAKQLSGGGAVTKDHREIKPDSGQQKGYVILTQSERAKGFVRPVRGAYRHLKCGKITTMNHDIAETYARDPKFYDGTFCVTCRSHFPVGENGEFNWLENDGSDGPKVGT